MNKINTSALIEKYSRFILLLLIVAVMAVLRPEAFWTWRNISTVIFQQAPFTILMSFGMTMAIITKGIDKSMGSVLVLASCIAGSFIKNNQIFLGVSITLLIGLACGFLNGILITKIGLFPFIATYGVDFIALGIAYVYTGGISVYDFPMRFRNVSIGNYYGITNLALITLAIFIALHLLTAKTTFGRKMYSAGFNAQATALSGINVKSTITIVYTINGLLAAITGLLFMARLNAADPNIGGNFTMDSIAATLIGGTSFGGGKGSITNAVVGSLIVVFIRNGMNIMVISANWQQAAIGFIILLSIFLEVLSKKVVSRNT